MGFWGIDPLDVLDRLPISRPLGGASVVVVGRGHGESIVRALELGERLAGKRVTMGEWFESQTSRFLFWVYLVGKEKIV